MPRNWLEEILVPRGVLLGAAAAFLACCLGGWLTSRIDYHPGFERFHTHLPPETLYYPTAFAVRSLARARADADKVVVVVGGSSILYGLGQVGDGVWTKRLQRLLGDQFRVINLGFRGAFCAEFGAVAAEMLLREHPRLILLTDAPTGALGRPEGQTHRAFFWDAWSRGLLFDSPARRARVARFRREHAGDAQHAERMRGLALDRRLHFNDLWNAVSCTVATTVWSPPLGARFFLPRRLYPDCAATQVPLPAQTPDLLERWTGSLKAITANPGVHRDGRGGWGEEPERWRQFDETARACFPVEELRRRTLLVLEWHCAACLRRLAPEERELYGGISGVAVRDLAAQGLEAVEVGRTFEPDDHADLIHLTESGGAKMAELVAPRVRGLARRLGYLE